MTKVRAALRAGKPPQFLFDGAKSRSKWTQRARTLLLGFQMYEDSLCSGCGQSAFHALNVAHSRRYSVATETCLGCAARETYSKNHKSDVAGLKVFVENTMGPGIEKDWE